MATVLFDRHPTQGQPAAITLALPAERASLRLPEGRPCYEALHLGASPTGGPSHIAARCGHDDYVCLNATARGVRLLCERSTGLWLFEVGDEAEVDPRPALREVTFAQLRASVDERGARWVRTGREVHRVEGGTMGSYRFLARMKEPIELTRRATLVLPGGHLYDLDPPGRAPLQTGTSAWREQELARRLDAALANPTVAAVVAGLAALAPNGLCALVALDSGRCLAGALPENSPLEPGFVPWRLADASLVPQALSTEAFVQCLRVREVPLALRLLDGPAGGVVPHGVLHFEGANGQRYALLRPLSERSGLDEDKRVAAVLQALLVDRTGPVGPPLPNTLARWADMKPASDEGVAFARFARFVRDRATAGCTNDGVALLRDALATAASEGSRLLARLVALLALIPLLDQGNLHGLRTERLDVAVAAALTLRLSDGGFSNAGQMPFADALAFCTEATFPEYRLSDEVVRLFGAEPTRALTKLSNARGKFMRAALADVGVIDLLLAPRAAERIRLSSGIELPWTRADLNDVALRDSGADEAILRDREGYLRTLLQRRQDEAPATFAARATSARNQLGGSVDRHPTVAALLRNL